MTDIITDLTQGPFSKRFDSLLTDLEMGRECVIGEARIVRPSKAIGANGNYFNAIVAHPALNNGQACDMVVFVEPTDEMNSAGYFVDCVIECLKMQHQFPNATFSLNKELTQITSHSMSL